jgi:hypothetical protein
MSGARKALRRDYDSTMPDWGLCPVCGQAAVWSGSADRFFHADGSDNTKCWLKLLCTGIGGSAQRLRHSIVEG